MEKCRLSLTSLEIPQTTTMDEWMKIGSALKRFYSANKWWVGDWLNFGESKYGETYAQAMEETGMQYDTLKNYKWVAHSVPNVIRNDNLSFSHHYMIARFDPKEQKALLEIADQEKMTRDQFKAFLKDRYSPAKQKEECDHEWVCIKCNKAKI